MKKLLYIAAGLFFFGIIPHVLAASAFVPLAGIPGLTQNVTANTAGLAGFFNNLYKYLIGIAATLAVIQIIWSGIKIAFNQDNVSTITDSKGHITQAILGLVIVLSPVVVFSIINPSILNLSLNLPKIDLTTKTAAPSNTAASTASAVTGCTPQNGPASGTLLTTCTASDVATANKEAQQFLTDNKCTKGNGKNGVAFPGTTSGCTTAKPNGSTPGATTCTGASAVAYCSPIVTVPYEAKSNDAIDRYYIENYLSDSGNFVNACTGNWKPKAVASGGSDIVLCLGALCAKNSNDLPGKPTQAQCPTQYQNQLNKKISPPMPMYLCASIQVYCAYYP